MQIKKAVVALLLLSIPGLALADLRVGATRVVYDGGSTAASNLRIHNIGKTVSLIQVWLDEGQQDAALENLRTPYVATPALFRLEAGKNRDIQVRPVDASKLPADRESLLWLNILDVPARTKGDDAAPLEFAMRWRLKIFHRPTGLQGNAASAPDKLQWSMDVDGEGHPTLRADNPSPYFVSLSKVVLGGREVPIEADHAQVRPLSAWRIRADLLRPTQTSTALQITWLDDVGVEHVTDAEVSHQATSSTNSSR